MRTSHFIHFSLYTLSTFYFIDFSLARICKIWLLGTFFGLVLVGHGAAVQFRGGIFGHGLRRTRCLGVCGLGNAGQLAWRAHLLLAWLSWQNRMDRKISACEPPESRTLQSVVSPPWRMDRIFLVCAVHWRHSGSNRRFHAQPILAHGTLYARWQSPALRGLDDDKQPLDVNANYELRI